MKKMMATAIAAISIAMITKRAILKAGSLCNKTGALLEEDLGVFV